MLKTNSRNQLSPLNTSLRIYRSRNNSQKVWRSIWTTIFASIFCRDTCQPCSSSTWWSHPSIYRRSSRLPDWWCCITGKISLKSKNFWSLKMPMRNCVRLGTCFKALQTLATWLHSKKCVSSFLKAKLRTTGKRLWRLEHHQRVTSFLRWKTSSKGQSTWTLWSLEHSKIYSNSKFNRATTETLNSSLETC